MAYRIQHTTHYRYSETVNGCHHLAHLMPTGGKRQRCLDSAIEIDPPPRSLRHFQDYFGNTASSFDILGEHNALTVTTHSRVELTSPPPALDDTPWDDVRRQLLESDSDACLLAREFSLPSPLVPPVPGAWALAAPLFTPGRPYGEALRELMALIHSEFRYQPGSTDVATPLARVLEERTGVCQDFAHLMLACLRSLGLPAQYLSGYLETRPPPGQPRLAGADASHAWVAVYSPTAGWMELDPTNNLVPDMHHIRLARGRDYADCAPLQGVLFGGGEHALEVSVDVVADSLGG